MTNSVTLNEILSNDDGNNKLKTMIAAASEQEEALESHQHQHDVVDDEESLTRRNCFGNANGGEENGDDENGRSVLQRRPSNLDREAKLRAQRMILERKREQELVAQTDKRIGAPQITISKYFSNNAHFLSSKIDGNNNNSSNASSMPKSSTTNQIYSKQANNNTFTINNYHEERREMNKSISNTNLSNRLAKSKAIVIDDYDTNETYKVDDGDVMAGKEAELTLSSLNTQLNNNHQNHQNRNGFNLKKLSLSIESSKTDQHHKLSSMDKKSSTTSTNGCSISLSDDSDQSNAKTSPNLNRKLEPPSLTACKN